MNCQEALEKLYKILDKEGTEVDEKLIREHLDECSCCCESFRIEKAFHEFLESCLCDAGCEEAKLIALKKSVADRLDAIDCEPQETKTGNKKTVIMSLAAAASIVFVLGASYFGYLLYDHSQAYGPIEQAHFAAAISSEILNSDVSLISETARNELNYIISDKIAGYMLVGGSMMEVMGIEMAHFLYTKGDSKISVFVAPSDRVEIPKDALKHEVLINGKEYFDHNCWGCRVVYHQNNSTLIITASQDKSAELLDFIPGKSII